MESLYASGYESVSLEVNAFTLERRGRTVFLFSNPVVKART
jgi:hypothetical protein